MRLFALFVGFWLIFADQVHGQANNPAHLTDKPFSRDGTAAQVVLPPELHMKNTGGNDRTKKNPLGEPGKGSGLCVFTSINHAALFQNVPELQHFQTWMTKRAGGGWAAKVDQTIAEFSREQKAEVPDYLQVESNDLEILKHALQGKRMVGVTYYSSPTRRYAGEISHMVNLVAAGVGKGPDGRGWWCILDNNYPRSYEWMSEGQFQRAYQGNNRGWAVILLAPSAPPLPLVKE